MVLPSRHDAGLPCVDLPLNFHYWPPRKYRRIRIFDPPRELSERHAAHIYCLAGRVPLQYFT